MRMIRMIHQLYLNFPLQFAQGFLWLFPSHYYHLNPLLTIEIDWVSDNTWSLTATRPLKLQLLRIAERLPQWLKTQCSSIQLMQPPMSHYCQKTSLQKLFSYGYQEYIHISAEIHSSTLQVLSTGFDCIINDLTNRLLGIAFQAVGIYSVDDHLKARSNKNEKQPCRKASPVIWNVYY